MEDQGSSPTIETPPVSRGPYQHEYLEWKGWEPQNFGKLTIGDCRYYNAQLKRTGISPSAEGPLRVLEVGFGNGRFLAYARKRGWKISGTELNSELVELAKRNNFDATCTDDLGEFGANEFDLIVAFDVLEHIEQRAILDFVRQILRILKPSGAFLARFPNGDSPFGLYHQHGDFTHVSVIGSGKVEYLARQLQATVVFLGGEAEPIILEGVAKTLYRAFAVPARKLINWLIRGIFFPRTSIAFCSINLVAVLRRNGDRR
jgi:SAM-dependent methyltransferase